MDTLGRILISFRWNSNAAFEVNLGKFSCLVLTCIELSSAIVLFTVCLKNQLELSLTLGLLYILSTFTSLLVFRQPQFVYFKLHLVIHCIHLVSTISMFPVAVQWSEASTYLCDFIFESSSDDSAIQICEDLISRRNSLQVILILGLIFHLIILMLDILVIRRFGVMKRTALMLREERKKKREEILQARAEQERRHKEEQRRELKAKILLMKEGNISQYDRAVGEYERKSRT